MNATDPAGKPRSDVRAGAVWLLLAAVVALAAVLSAIVADGAGARTAATAVAAIAVVAMVLVERILIQGPLVRSVEEARRNAEVAQAERERAERLASAGRLVAMLLHELGNPLSAIVNYSHSLQQKSPPELRPTLEALQREAFRIERLRDGFLDFVRPRDGENGAGADLAAALKATLEFLGDQGALKKIQVDLHIPEKAVPTRGTALELEQAIANLVLNAADAMPEGGRLVIWAERQGRQAFIDAQARRTDGSEGHIVYPRRRDDRLVTWLESLDTNEVVKIVVADSGKGFQHHGDIDRLFEPFFTTKPRDEGMGLGLTVVRRVVDSMQGIVWAQRSREGGAAFHILLPVQTEVPAAKG